MATHIPLTKASHVVNPDNWMGKYTSPTSRPFKFMVSIGTYYYYRGENEF